MLLFATYIDESGRALERPLSCDAQGYLVIVFGVV